MRKILYMALAALAFAATSCSKAEKNEKVDLTGEWNIVEAEFTTKSVELGDVTIDVYLSFRPDGSFELYQMVGQGRYQLYEGTWVLNGDILEGVYSNGKKWGNVYKVSRDGDMLRMQAIVGSSDVYVYRKCEIPADIK